MTFLRRWFGKGDSDDILVAFELHSVERIREALDAGLDLEKGMQPRAPTEV